MAAQNKYPMTMAIRMLEEHQVAFTPYLFPYVEKGGTAYSSQTLGIPEHHVIKTLIMENDKKEPLVILMHGDMKVSTKNLARALNVKSISPCKPEIADKNSGYQIGGTSPFGTNVAMPVYIEETILDIEKIYINGGARGFLVSMSPQEIVRVLQPILVNVGIKSES